MRNVGNVLGLVRYGKGKNMFLCFEGLFGSHQMVKGLYMWCQYCSHGGHLDCMKGMRKILAFSCSFL